MSSDSGKRTRQCTREGGSLDSLQQQKGRQSMWYRFRDFWLPVQQVRSLEVITPVLSMGKEMKKNEDQQLFLGRSENWGHRADHCPPHWEDRYIDTKNHSLGEQNSPPELVTGLENLNCKWQNVCDSVCTRLEVKNPRRAQIYGAPVFYVICL